MTATVQWEAVAGVTHAWMAQCEGYVSLCGREVSGFGGQRSGIRCAQCTTSNGWAEQTGEPSYLTPQRDHVHAEAPPAHQPRRRPRRVMPEMMMVDSLPAPVQVAPVEPPLVVDDRQDIIDVAPKLAVPESLEAYQSLPEAERHYWAPMMLARAGQEAVWDRAQETSEQFQQRCYLQVQAQGT